MEPKGTGYGQYCPITRALDVLGERWSLLVMRELLLGAHRFNEIARGLPGMSRSLLTKRLRQFERGGLVDRLGNEYLLTEAGAELEPIVFGFGAWGAKWAFGDPHPDELDPALLVWWMHERLDTSDLPGRRHVFRVEFRDHPRAFWIVVEAGDASVCDVEPGFDVDVTISSDLASLYQVWLGRVALDDAVRDGRVVFEGPSALTRRMPRVFQLSPIAPVVAAYSTAP